MSEYHSFQSKGPLDREQDQTGVRPENCHHYDGCYYCGMSKDEHIPRARILGDPPKTFEAPPPKSLSTFEAQLDAKLELYRKKNADYTGGLSTYFNFEQTAKLIAPLVRDGVDPVDVVFQVMLGVKLSRITALTISGKAPNHESLIDSHTDFANYAEIWEAYKRDKAKA